MTYERIREQATSPLCGEQKAYSAVTCWPRYRDHNLRYATPDDVRAKLDVVEAALPPVECEAEEDEPLSDESRSYRPHWRTRCALRR
jgi:hypothetical protein